MISAASSQFAKTGGVGALKYAMELMGYYGGPPRLPFCPPNAAMRASIEEAFRDMRG
jgi:4-hydroxy-2-oxoglutarate aldolase